MRLVAGPHMCGPEQLFALTLGIYIFAFAKI
jgi:hypothetical protein